MKVCGVLADTDTNDKRLLNWKNLLTACLKGNFDERLYSDIDFFQYLVIRSVSPPSVPTSSM